MKKFLKKFICLIIATTMITNITGCKSAEDELVAFYSSDDNVVNTDIGQFLIGRTAPLLTEDKLCYITNNQLEADSNLNCNAAILIDVTDNKLIQAQNIYDKIYPASITKLLTAYVVLKYGNMDDEITIEEDDCGITEAGAQLIGFKKGDVIKVSDLLYCLLVYSGNDSATALAEYIAGSESAFCDKMNEEAKKLGCNNTHYTNPHGLHDENHYTCAYDVYIVLEACMQYELFKTISQTVDYEFTHKTIDGTYATKSFSTTNKFKLGNYELPAGVTILGGKTGNTYAAGSNLIMNISTEDGKEYVVGLFGEADSESLYTQMTYLINKVAGSSTAAEIGIDTESEDTETSDDTQDNKAESE
jgi:D-alanyl-D-alanine carboxypeptidase (penicillin-binding protein 5/6)